MTTTTATMDQLERPDWLGPDRFPFTLRRFDDLHYIDEGVGPTLVFVHAGLWSFIWRDAIVDLRADHRCIAVDFPGAGLSGGEPSDIDLAQFGRLLEMLLDHCGVERATLVIHDLGGVVGVMTAAARPDRIDGIVATNSFAWPADKRSLKAMLGFMGGSFATGVLGTTRLIPRLTRSGAGVGRHFDSDDRRVFFGPYRSRQRARNFHRVMRSAVASQALYEQAEAALAGDLAHLPVLTVFGEKNDPFGFGDRWQELFPSAESWVVPGGNHFPMCDDPEGYAERIRTWHRRCVARA